MTAPTDSLQIVIDRRWMEQALALADAAAARGEVPVGAIVVRDEQALGRGYNRPISSCDPSAHAEMVALRAAALRAGNYRLPGTVLYVTMEPCPMCFGALIHARVARIVYGARDERWGAAGSVLNLHEGGQFNHAIDVHGGVLAEQSRNRLRAFFKARR